MVMQWAMNTHHYTTPWMPGRLSFTISENSLHTSDDCTYHNTFKQTSYEFRRLLSLCCTFHHNYFYLFIYQLVCVSHNRKNINALQTRKTIDLSFSFQLWFCNIYIFVQWQCYGSTDNILEKSVVCISSAQWLMKIHPLREAQFLHCPIIPSPSRQRKYLQSVKQPITTWHHH